ncbi:hypothetical protein, partial [Actinopolymorpha pittospori]|uniref:hypothetical protein n=1 Tax=Actinopolymorpha pittospori TaxID=648752 RepID=UPI0031E61A0C
PRSGRIQVTESPRNPGRFTQTVPAVAGPLPSFDREGDHARPRAGTIGVSVIVAVALGLIAYFVLGVGRPGPTDRAYVQAKLDQAAGVPMALPVELPAGYSVPDYYYFLPDNDRMVRAGPGQDVAAARAVNFEPINPGPLRTRPTTGPTVCATHRRPGQAMQRARRQRPGQSRRGVWSPRRTSSCPVLVVVHAMVDVPETDEWQTVDFTTDLNKVRWLH